MENRKNAWPHPEERSGQMRAAASFTTPNHLKHPSSLRRSTLSRLLSMRTPPIYEKILQRKKHTFKKHFHWPFIANDVWNTPKTCVSYAKIGGTRARHQAKIKLFPAVGPLNSVAMASLAHFQSPFMGFSSSW